MDFYRMGADAYYKIFRRLLRPRAFHMLTEVLRNAPRFDMSIHRCAALMMIAKRFSDFRDLHGNEGIRLVFDKLAADLDEESVRTLGTAWESFLMIADNDRIPFTRWYPALDKSDEAEMDKRLIGIERSLKAPPYIEVRHFPDIFYHYSGLSFVPKKIIDDKVTGHDILDCGAFNGDTALMFSRLFSPNKVYSFEPLEENYLRLLNTVEYCALDNVVPLKLALGSEKGRSMLVPRSSGSYLSVDSNEGTQVEVDSIDSFIEKNNANPGLIKMDIEGSEYDAIKGGLDTIKQYRPILSIAIYHTPKDFFLIKPFLESELDGYRFMVRKLQYCNPVAEIFLIAYPIK